MGLLATETLYEKILSGNYYPDEYCHLFPKDFAKLIDDVLELSLKNDTELTVAENIIALGIASDLKLDTDTIQTYYNVLSVVEDSLETDTYKTFFDKNDSVITVIRKDLAVEFNLVATSDVNMHDLMRSTTLNLLNEIATDPDVNKADFADFYVALLNKAAQLHGIEPDRLHALKTQLYDTEDYQNMDNFSDVKMSIISLNGPS